MIRDLIMAAAGVAAGGFSNNGLSFVANSTGTTSSPSAVVPASAAAGDWAFFMQVGGANGAAAPASSVPSGWTSVVDVATSTTNNQRMAVSWKKLVSGDLGTTITGFTGATFTRTMIAVFRSTSGSTGTVSSMNQEASTTSPASQTVTCASLSSSLVVLAFYNPYSALTGVTKSFSPAQDSEIAIGGSVAASVRYKIYNASPADTTVSCTIGSNSSETLSSFCFMVS